MIIYLIMREEDLNTDGHYYESTTSVIYACTNPTKAVELLKHAGNRYYAGVKPSHSEHDKYGETEIIYSKLNHSELADRFYIDVVYCCIDGKKEE